MRHLTEKFHGSFSVAIFQFAVGGTHAAERLKLATGTDGLPGALGIANFAHVAAPAILKIALTKIVAILLGKYTDGHAPAWINGATVLAAAATVLFRPLHTPGLGQLRFRHFAIFRFANRILEIQPN